MFSVAEFVKSRIREQFGRLFVEIVEIVEIVDLLKLLICWYHEVLW